MRQGTELDGRVYQEKTDAKTGKVYRYYVEEGTIPPDWWIIQQLNREEKERLHYPTQKPEALLERIVKASSKEGDTVADFFCGCGTAIAVAQKLNRQWIGVDISHLAIRLVMDSVVASVPNGNGMRSAFLKSIDISGFPRDIASARELAGSTTKSRIKFQDWIIEFKLGGVSNDLHRGFDGYLAIYRDAKTKDIILIEVKSGATDVEDIREFRSAIDSEKAAMGVFVCFEDKVTRQMQREANMAGYYDQEAFGTRFPRLQILTVEALLKDQGIKHPNPAIFNITFKKAQR